MEVNTGIGKRSWPSRRMQIAAIVILTVGALLQVFLPPLSRQGRAEKLYLDAWAISSGPWFHSSKRSVAVQKLEKALELSPGNDLFEQALVWQYPREKLENLVQDRNLGEGAKRLAAGLMAEALQEENLAAQMTSYTSEPTTEPEEKQLAEWEKLQLADPNNGLVRYRKAAVLERLGRIDEAIEEVQAGNATGKIIYYYPAVNPRITDTLIYIPVLSDSFSDYARERGLARMIRNRANELLRQGETEEARSILEDCCTMSVKVAAAEPHQLIQLLVAKAIFNIGALELDPLYADLGMEDRLAALRQTEKIFDDAVDYARPITNDFFVDLSRYTAAPTMAAFGGLAAGAVAFVAGLLWAPATIARKRRKEAALTLALWQEGSLARMLLALYLPLFALLALFLALFPHLLPYFAGFSLMSDLTSYIVVVGLVQVGIVACTIRRLHRIYDEAEEERTTILQFLFKAPAAAKAWARKHVACLMVAQLLFLFCCFALMTVVYEPWAGGHPWEVIRFKINGYSEERALVERAQAKLATTWTYARAETGKPFVDSNKQ